MSFDPEKDWPEGIKGKRNGTARVLQGVAIWHDFDWREKFKKKRDSEKRFVGQEGVRALLDDLGHDFTKLIVLLTRKEGLKMVTYKMDQERLCCVINIDWVQQTTPSKKETLRGNLIDPSVALKLVEDDVQMTGQVLVGERAVQAIEEMAPEAVAKLPSVVLAMLERLHDELAAEDRALLFDKVNEDHLEVLAALLTAAAKGADGGSKFGAAFKAVMEAIPLAERAAVLLELPELLQTAVEEKVTAFEVKALAYRKQQLEEFRKLLFEKDYFDGVVAASKGRGAERVWQDFFEKNSWLFGTGLQMLFVTGLSGKKLEQVTSGSAVNRIGKRVDVLAQTCGFISSLCFVEIKTHRTELLHQGEPYREECFQISRELSGAVAQVQKTVFKSMLDIRERLEVKDRLGVVREVVYQYQPKSYLVIGTMGEFLEDGKVREYQHASFELFRRNLVAPEIVTFDELYERARFVVDHELASKRVVAPDAAEQVGEQAPRLPPLGSVVVPVSPEVVEIS